MRVLWIRTGGTIDSEQTAHGLRPARCTDDSLLQAADCVLEQITPFCIDSSDLTCGQIEQLAKIIRGSTADGFVITHGTDTLAYTAAGLSFLLPDERRPVVLTGAMRPLFESGSDGASNLAGALEAVRHPAVYGVHVFFAGRLFFGTHIWKNDSMAADAFISPGAPVAGRMEQDGLHLLHRQKRAARFSNSLGGQATPVWVYPGFDSVRLADLSAQAVILIGYGAGNLPAGVVHAAAGSAQDFYVITQCLHGGVDLSMYQAGEAVRRAGIVPLDVTPAVAVMKAAAVYAVGEPELMQQDLIGEARWERR